jgi:beta-glucosidase
MDIPEKLDYPVNLEVVKKYFRVTEDPAGADVALVFISGPNSGNGYSNEDALSGGNGYVPISLQYGPYTAKNARAESIAGGDPKEMFTNRTYKDKTIKAINITDLDMVRKAYDEMKGKPVIVSMQLSNPAVVAEFEKMADAIMVHFGVQDQALIDILTGVVEPSALLPLQMPANMETVETQKEDTPHDMQVHVDEAGNRYDFAFGMNWKGMINDARVKKYKGKKAF